MLERISPEVIVLDPPEKLVIETRASGGYQRFDWQRNTIPFTLTQGQPFTVTLQELPNFFEIFVREPTTTNDLGVYEVDLVINTGSQAPEVQFAVTPYSKYTYICNFECLNPGFYLQGLLLSFMCAQTHTYYIHSVSTTLCTNYRFYF